MLTPERITEILRLVAQLPEQERVRAAVAMVVGWEAQWFHRWFPLPWMDRDSGLELTAKKPDGSLYGPWPPISHHKPNKWFLREVPNYTTSLDDFMRDVEPWFREEGGDMILESHEDVWLATCGFTVCYQRIHAVPATACCLALLRAVGLGELTP